MTDKKRAMWTAIGGGVLIVIILLLLRKNGAMLNTTIQNVLDNPKPTDDGPVYQGGSYDFGPINLGSIFLNAPPSVDDSCGCGCAQSSTDFSSVYETAANRYSDNLNRLQAQVAGAMLAAVPPFVSQYFNDSQAFQQYQGSLAALGANQVDWRP